MLIPAFARCASPTTAGSIGFLLLIRQDGRPNTGYSIQHYFTVVGDSIFLLPIVVRCCHAHNILGCGMWEKTHLKILGFGQVGQAVGGKFWGEGSKPWKKKVRTRNTHDKNFRNFPRKYRTGVLVWIFSEGNWYHPTIPYLPLVGGFRHKFLRFRHYDMVLLAPPLPQTFRALSTPARNFYVRFGKKLSFTWRNHRLPSPPQINPSVSPSVHLSVSTCLQIRYSAENSTGPTDLVQNHESMMWIENSGVNEISHKTQNKKTGPTDSINNSWEFHGFSSPRAAHVCCNVKYY